MQVFPKGAKEWVRAGLLPFQTYVIAAFLVVEIGSRIPTLQYRWVFLEGILLGYCVCIVVFLLVGIIQLFFHPRKPALVSFFFAQLAVLLAFLVVPPLVRA